MSRETKRGLRVYLEIVGLVVGLALVNLTVWPHKPGFVGVAPHPILFVTMLVVARYGLIAGIVAAAACAAEYATMFLAVDKRPLYELVSGANAQPLVVLVPLTVFLGMLVQYHIDRRRRADDDAARARAELAKAEERLASLRDINLELGDRIINAQSTRLMLLHQLEPLAAAEPARLDHVFASVLADVLHAESAAVWRLGGGEATMTAHVGAAPRPLPPEVERHFGERDVLAAHDAVGESFALPLYLGRVRAGRGGAATLFVAVDGIALQAAPEADELFAALVGWFSVLVGQARAAEARSGRARSGVA